MKQAIAILVLGLLVCLTACSKPAGQPSQTTTKATTTTSGEQSVGTEQEQQGETTTKSPAGTSTSVGGFIIVDEEIELTEDE